MLAHFPSLHDLVPVSSGVSTVLSVYVTLSQHASPSLHDLTHVSSSRSPNPSLMEAGSGQGSFRVMLWESVANDGCNCLANMAISGKKSYQDQWKYQSCRIGCLSVYFMFRYVRHLSHIATEMHAKFNSYKKTQMSNLLTSKALTVSQYDILSNIETASSFHGMTVI